MGDDAPEAEGRARALPGGLGSSGPRPAEFRGLLAPSASAQRGTRPGGREGELPEPFGGPGWQDRPEEGWEPSIKGTAFRQAKHTLITE